MLPINLDCRVGRIGLAGHGDALARRRDWLLAGGVSPIEIGPNGPVRGLKFLFVVGYDGPTAAGIVRRAHSAGVLVNVEDQPSLCDFHVPAVVRRGDLVLSVSTGGRAPGLSKLVREWLDRRFGPEWKHYLDQAGDARVAWRAEGAGAAELSRKTRELAQQGSWLA